MYKSTGNRFASANIRIIYIRAGASALYLSFSLPLCLSYGLSYNINKGSFRAGVPRIRGRALARAMLAMSGKGGMF